MTGSMSQIVGRINGRIDDKIRGATSEVFSNIIQMTPVGEPSQWKNPASAPEGYVGGNARGNWHCTIGSPFVGEDRTSTVEKIQSTIPRHSGSVVYLTNNVPYIRALEYDFHSRQAPAGMVRVSVALFEGVLNGTR
jgi:hypothetical protein